ncbi:hypothetical protein LJC63_05835 [Ruminococcaceae bacterium OttesenSCG-928-L11]|nr:hypothetical protein [Ruminococcaceae bacterium OttesenSCG-928-L11]
MHKITPWEAVTDMPDTVRETYASDQDKGITRKIPYDAAVKLLEALYIRAEGSIGAKEDLDKIKELLIL